MTEYIGASLDLGASNKSDLSRFFDGGINCSNGSNVVLASQT